MSDPGEKEIGIDLARQLVRTLSPQELPLFRAHSEAYFKDPAAVLKPRAGKDEMLGFGVGEALTLLTPVALAVAGEVARFLLEVVKESAKKSSSELVTGMAKELLAKPRGAAGPEPREIEARVRPPAPGLTPDQLMRVRRLAFAKARQLDISEAQAGLLADAVVGSLAAPGP